MKDIKVKLTFTESILGTMPNNENVYSDFIATKAPDADTIEDEIAAIGVEAVDEKGRTVFPRMEDGTPFLYDYQIRGFFKGACGFLKLVNGTESKKETAKGGSMVSFKKKIDGLIFVNERKIPFHNYGEISNCQRPLRAMTMQGERVSLASSDEIQAGAWVEFTIRLLCDDHEKCVREWLDFGQYNGIGQWRNSGHGRFVWEEVTA